MKFSVYSEQREEFQWHSYDNIKSHTKSGLYPLFKKFISEKTIGGGGGGGGDTIGGVKF